MQKTVWEVKMENKKKLKQVNRENALAAYEAKQAQIKKLLKQIEAAVEQSDKDRTEGVNWGHVGSLGHVVEELTEVRDWLKGTAK